MGFDFLEPQIERPVESGTYDNVTYIFGYGIFPMPKDGIVAHNSSRPYIDAEDGIVDCRYGIMKINGHGPQVMAVLNDRYSEGTPIKIEDLVLPQNHRFSAEELSFVVDKLINA